MASLGLDAWLVEILRCPSCGGEVTPLPDAAQPNEFRCAAENLAYPVRDGIPVMLVEQAAAGTESGAS